ncbi:MAG: FkbM family methyltransferase [Pseudolabrys sp.]|nr:FkbM family methyltransferase [Pseudolabrys sp.]MDP2297512.1 FkbM family methyltransferase [Pseudolabrys sp.]
MATRLVVKIRNQYDMVLGARFGGGHGFADSGEQWLSRLVAPHSAYFVDVGANVGEWTLMFAAQMPRPPSGLAFEPHPETAIRLRAALQKAGLAGCEVIEAAAAERAGTAPFFAESNHGETSSLHATRPRQSANKIDVKLCRLDDELSRRQIAEIDVLKIDAEGHDFFVLLGAEAYIATRRIKLIQFEYNAAWIDAGATLTRAVAYLETHGYVVRLLRADGLYELDVGRCGEYFKYSNFVAFVPGAFGGLLDRMPSRPAL